MKRSLLAGLILLSSGVFAQAADVVPLRMNETVGLTWKFDSKQSTDSKNQATMNGQTQNFGSKSSQHQAGTAQVLAVANGVPSSIKVSFDKDCSATNEMNTNTSTQSSPYAGATITVTRNADGTVTDDFTGQADPDSQSELHTFLDHDAVVTPTRPVSVGDEWAGDPAAVGRVLQITNHDTGGMTIKLLSVKNIDNHPVAELKVSFAVNKGASGMDVKVVAQGTELVDLATGHTIRSDFSGSADISGKQQGQGPDGQPATYDIQGTGTLTIATTAGLSDGPAVATLAPVPAPVANVPAGANPLGGASASTYAGTFSNDNLKVDLQPKGQSGGDAYEGTITLKGQAYPAAAVVKGGVLTGSFNASGTDFPFTATLDSNTLTLTSGKATYILKKPSANPLDSGAASPSAPNPLGQ